jgi:nucleoside-diphosphate-sugar epimerase
MSFNETVFLTGFPGFIAGRLVQRLAADGARLLLLVQPALMERARRDVAALTGEESLPSEAFRLIEGDITLPGLGMDQKDADLVHKETTVIFHLAALYDLACELDLAWRVNVEGTRHLNGLARSIKNLRRYHYVSTCYVAGKRRGVIREDELLHDAGFRNHYEATKYLAETEVSALIHQLPITIHRPSVVCGDSHTGETAKYDGIYYLMKYLLKMPGWLSVPNIGNRHVSLNLVPVDWVVDSLAALAQDEHAVGKTVQLADPAPLTTKELFNALAGAIGDRKSWFTVPRPIVYRSLMLPISPPITGLPRSAVPYFFLQQTYDTTEAVRLLTKHGRPCPSFSSYVDRLVEYVRAHPDHP